MTPLCNAHVQKRGWVGGPPNIIPSPDQIPLSNPGLWPSSSSSGLALRAELEGFLQQTDRRLLRNSDDLHSPPYAAAGRTLGRDGGGGGISA